MSEENGSRGGGLCPIDDSLLYSIGEDSKTLNTTTASLLKNCIKLVSETRRVWETIEECRVASRFQTGVDLRSEESKSRFVEHLQGLAGASEKLAEAEIRAERLDKEQADRKGEVDRLSAQLKETVRWKNELEEVVREVSSRSGLTLEGVMSSHTLEIVKDHFKSHFDSLSTVRRQLENMGRLSSATPSENATTSIRTPVSSAFPPTPSPTQLSNETLNRQPSSSTLEAEKVRLKRLERPTKPVKTGKHHSGRTSGSPPPPPRVPTQPAGPSHSDTSDESVSSYEIGTPAPPLPSKRDKIPKNKWKFLCPEQNCNSKFEILTHLKKHLKNKHKQLDPYKEFNVGCSFCGLKLIDKRALHKHRPSRAGKCNPPSPDSLVGEGPQAPYLNKPSSSESPRLPAAHGSVARMNVESEDREVLSPRRNSIDSCYYWS